MRFWNHLGSDRKRWTSDQTALLLWSKRSFFPHFPELSREQEKCRPRVLKISGTRRRIDLSPLYECRILFVWAFSDKNAVSASSRFGSKTVFRRFATPPKSLLLWSKNVLFPQCSWTLSGKWNMSTVGPKNQRSPPMERSPRVVREPRICNMGADWEKCAFRASSWNFDFVKTRRFHRANPSRQFWTTTPRTPNFFLFSRQPRAPEKCRPWVRKTCGAPRRIDLSPH